MKKKNLLTRTWNNITSFGEKHEQEIYLGLKIAGLVSTAILAWRAGAKADSIIKESKEKIAELEDRTDISEEEKTEKKREETVSTIKKLVPVVLPMAVVGGATVTCDILNYKSVGKKIAFLTAAYNISEKEIKELQDKTEELFGKKKAEELKDEVAISGMQKAFSDISSDEIVDTGKGSVLFYLPITGTFFRSSWESVRSAATEVMANWNAGYYDSDDEVRYSEFIYELGLPATIGECEAAKAFSFKRDRHTRKAEVKLRPSTGSVIFEGTKESGTVVDFFDSPTISESYVVHDSF